MPKCTELIIRMEDKPGTLGDCCKALSGHGINILAFQGYEYEGQSLIRAVVDKPETAKQALDAAGIYCTENAAAQVAVPHRPGELSRLAALLGEAEINIRYAYCGTDPRSNMPIVVFGVTDAAKAATLLDKAADDVTRAA